MKYINKIFSLVVIVFVQILLSTTVAFALDGGTPPPGRDSGTPPPGRDVGDPAVTGRDNGTPGGASDGLSYELKNPLAFDSLEELIVAILNVLIVIITPIVVLFIILAGFKYVTARGNPSQIQEATQALTYAIIGGVLIIGAVVIAGIIENLVTSFKA